MKKIIISEQQYNNIILKETALPTFSLETFKNMSSLKEKIQYCKDNLKHCKVKDSSRAIFQIDDEKLLKLAMNKKGTIQNQTEVQPDEHAKQLDICPEIYVCADDYSWIITSYLKQNFSLAKLNNMTSVNMRYEYCKSHLGEPIGEGSSRAAFLLSDEHVLKLAYGNMYNAGCDQNEVEFNTMQHNMQQSFLFPQVYQHADNFSWIITEHVVDGTILDFQKVLGMPFDDGDEDEKVRSVDKDIPIEDDGKYDQYDYNTDITTRQLRTWQLDDYRDYTKYEHEIKKLNPEEEYPTFMGFIRWLRNPNSTNVNYKTLLFSTNPNYQWWREIVKYIKDNNWAVDFDIDNFGLALRNGQPTIVILDSGFNQVVQEKYY